MGLLNVKDMRGRLLRHHLLVKYQQHHDLGKSYLHQVYPFRTPDGKGERRSVSFNAVFSSKFMQEEEKKDNKW